METLFTGLGLVVAVGSITAKMFHDRIKTLSDTRFEQGERIAGLEANFKAQERRLERIENKIDELPHRINGKR